MFASRFAAAGHDVAFYANYGVNHWQPNWNGFNVYPGDSEWGDRTMSACAAHHADDGDCLVIGLFDPWVVHPEKWSRDVRMALWAPVDTNPLSPAARVTLTNERVTPIAMSRHGERMMREANLDPFYCPHGVDTEMFRPRPDERSEIRAELGVPDGAFLVGMVAANKGLPIFPRKCFPQVFQAFARFREEHQDAVLYVHTNELIEAGDGLLLRQLANRLGIPRKALLITDAFRWELGIKREDVARMMSAFDVLASPSAGEGFGIPIIESQACGVPVIVTDHSAMTELCGTGWLVDGDPWYSGPLDAWFKVPFVSEILSALEKAYDVRDEAGLLVSAAREFAMQYDADRVMEEHWLPILATLERPTEIGPLVPAREAVAA